jgi:hypothetical protein
MTHSFLRSNFGKANMCHVRSWGSTLLMMEIGRREDETGVDGSDKSCSFEVQSLVEARFMRIRKIGPSANGS